MLPQQNNRPEKHHYYVAAFIVGCLMREELLTVIKKDEIDSLSFENAVRIIAVCLRDSFNPDGDYTPLPFDW